MTKRNRANAQLLKKIPTFMRIRDDNTDSSGGTEDNLIKHATTTTTAATTHTRTYTQAREDDARTKG